MYIYMRMHIYVCISTCMEDSVDLDAVAGMLDGAAGTSKRLSRTLICMCMYV